MMLCIYSVCTCCLCNVMYRVVHIVLCEYCICSVGYRWCYIHDWICGAMYISYCAHDGYTTLYCEYGVVHMLDMQCCV